ncbi:Arm DNA-binding domain-containing protein [Psychrobacter sp. JCM 18901]|uniref:Arm DNA-binding domain-containing protein n=1 Tax=Psychrobacter sp. JCM 18901 TaxID=1298609 RepID=UPI0004B80566|nr:Arm DNA-binding domain-containing protein [Psychrobacter sp. JCM 18901]
MAIDTANDINKLECRDKDYSVSVSGVAGLSLRIYPNGKKEYYLRYSHPHIEGKRPRMMLGKIEDVSLHEVKYKADTILDMVAKGSDPKAIQQKEQTNKYTHLKTHHL